MTFKKPTPPKVEYSPEELEQIEENDLELELFGKHELPIFLKELELYEDLEPQDALEALDAVFYLGLAGDTEFFQYSYRGKLPLENARTLYTHLESKLLTHEQVARWLRNTLAYARAKG